MAFPVMLYKISAYGISDVGLVRQNNEDFWMQLKEDLFFALADGMGGHLAGEVASKKAVESLCLLFKEKFSQSDQSLKSSKALISDSIEEINRAVYRMGRENEELRGMGTTLCCVFLHSEGIIVGHVGDSRVYRLRGGQLKQLTQDHSLLRELIELGQLNELQAKEFAYKNIITKAIGTEPSVEPTVIVSDIHAKDIILMCTDGLTDLLTHQEIQKIISETPAMDVPKKLVKAAKQKGGYDNITVVVIDIHDILPATE
jgi:protein phosphatase